MQNYTLIREMDARAIDYLYNNRQNPIFNNPQVVLFMNIGFSECEVFAIEFSRVFSTNINSNSIGCIYSSYLSS